MNYVNVLTGNLILNLSILSWAVAQVLKAVIILIMEHRFDVSRILGSGGMPSSHSAFVCACAASIGQMYGTSSPIFAVAVVVAIVVMYDASNVRRAAGEQAKILNYIMDNWNDMRPEFFTKELKTLLGHTPLQVFFGALLGIAIGYFGAVLFA